MRRAIDQTEDTRETQSPRKLTVQIPRKRAHSTIEERETEPLKKMAATGRALDTLGGKQEIPKLIDEKCMRCLKRFP